MGPTWLGLSIDNALEEDPGALLDGVALDFDGELRDALRLGLDGVGGSLYGSLGNKVHTLVWVHLLVDEVRPHGRIVIHFRFFPMSILVRCARSKFFEFGAAV